jgi:molecular chaperone Hsp33
MNKDNTVRESGGYMIQLMPDCPDDVISAIEKKVTAMPSVTDLLRNGKSPEEILTDILGELKLTIFESKPVRFKCDCSRERVEKALIALGRRELMSIVDDGREETLNCAFCNTDYTFTNAELRDVLRKCTQ